mgnify:CR=1 FL=1
MLSEDFIPANYNTKNAQPGFYVNFEGYREQVPDSPLLKQFVGTFYEITTLNSHSQAVPVVPDGCMDIVFISDTVSTRSYILRTAPSLLGMYVNSDRYVLGIRFKPVGISKFIHCDFQNDLSYMVPLQEYLGRNAFSPIEMNRKCLTFSQKCHLLEKILLRNLLTDSTSLELTFNIANFIIMKKGIVSIDDLSREYFYSPRYINKLFNQNVDMSPKHFCEVIQLQNVLNYLCHSDDKIVNIAATAGYYDQSHMNHVIQKLLHTTSSKLRSNEFFEKNNEKLDIKYIY